MHILQRHSVVLSQMLGLTRNNLPSDLHACSLARDSCAQPLKDSEHFSYRRGRAGRSSRSGAIQIHLMNEYVYWLEYMN